MKISVFVATITLLMGSLAATAVHAQESRESESNGTQQKDDSQSKQSDEEADDDDDDEDKAKDEEKNKQNDREQERDRQQKQGDQRQGRRGQNQDHTQYSGRERAALGVMLSEAGQGEVRVSEVVDDSPAHHAGLKTGDQIQKIDGQRVNSYRDVIRAINLKSPSDQVQITVQREGQEKQIDVALEERQEVFDQARQLGQRMRDRRGERDTSRQNDQRFAEQNRQQTRTERSENRTARRDDRYEQPRTEAFGQTGRQSDRDGQGRDDNRRTWRDEWQGRERDERASLGIAMRNERGSLRVTQVYQGSAAEQAGIRRGDQITAIDGQEVRSYGRLVDRLDEYQPGQRVSIDIVRNGEREQVRARLQDGEAQARQVQQAGHEAREDATQRFERRFEGSDQQRTGNREWEADRKQTGEAYDGKPNDNSDIQFDNGDF